MNFAVHESITAGWDIALSTGLRHYGSKVGGAGKDSLDGIRNFAGFGSQSVAANSRSIREEGNSAVVRYMAQAHPLQPYRTKIDYRALTHARVPPGWRTICRPDPGGHRGPGAGRR